MSVPIDTKMRSQDIAELKKEYLAYFKVVPMQKWAAQFIGRDEDTIIRWKTDDQDFADAVKKAESEAVKGRLKRVKDDWFLERVFKQDFAQRQELTGPEGKELTFKIVNYGDNTTV